MLWPWNLKTNYLRGKWAEFVARCYLRLNGYHILAHNYTKQRGAYAGEIDIIARHRKTIVFVEVKQRHLLENAFYAITPKQQQRIMCMAQNYMRCHPQFSGYDMRFDAVFICLPLTVRHLKNAWIASSGF